MEYLTNFIAYFQSFHVPINLAKKILLVEFRKFVEYICYPYYVPFRGKLVQFKGSSTSSEKVERKNTQ